jgi:hypothetical protein
MPLPRARRKGLASPCWLCLVPKLHLGTSLVLPEILFRADSNVIASRSAMELPQQARSRMEFGAQASFRTQNDLPPLPSHF